MNSTLTTTDLPGGLGVRVDDLPVEALDDTMVLAELDELMRSRSLILAHFPELAEDDQAKLATSFGVVTDRGGYGTSPDRGAGSTSAKPAGAMYVSNTREDGILGKGQLDFHHDHLFYEDPLAALMLYAIEIPPSGSETWFRSGASALESLPAELRARAEGIECRHLYDYVKLAERRYRDWDDPDDATPGSQSNWKPLVWTQPGTGRQALLLSQSTIDFRGIGREDGIALYKEIYDHLVGHEDEVACHRHRWQPGDLIAWDNLMVAHSRKPFVKTEPRTLRRTPILTA
ncbi:MAG: TauD/TfdA dioxygenase family protein [Acidimicrobiales bacterium]